MYKKIAVFILLVSPLPSWWGQGIPIRFENWPPKQEAWLKSLVNAINLQAPVMFYSPMDLEPRIWKKGKVTRTIGSGCEIVFGGIEPNAEDPGANAYPDTVAAHEWSHSYRAFRGSNRACFSLMPAALEEGWAEFSMWLFTDALRPIIASPARARTHSSNVHRGESPWPFLPRRADLGLQHAIRQEDPAGACVYKNYCWDFELAAYPLLQFVTAACDGSSLADCSSWVNKEMDRLRFELVESIRAKGEPYRMVNFEEFVERLDQKFSSVRVNGMNPKNFFGTSVIYGSYREGNVFSIEAIGTWRDSSGWFRSGPVNPNFVSFQAWFNPPLGSDNSPPARQPLEIGKYQIEIQGPGTEPWVVGTIDLTQTKGGDTFFINRSLKPGLYKVAAYEGEDQKKVSYFMVLKGLSTLDPAKDGVFIWNVREDGQINPEPINPPEGWKLVFAGNGLTQAIPPKGTRSVVLAGQEFTLTGDVEALRLNGSRNWPVLEVTPREIALSPTNPSAKVMVQNTNPLSRQRKPWTARARTVNEVEPPDWLSISEQSGGGNAAITVTAKVGLQGQGWHEGRICFQADEGISAPCVSVFYSPR